MLKELRLLLVEDTPVNAVVAGEILREAGYAHDLAVDGQEAIEAVRRVPYGLVLMDCQLPHVDGYEATRRIRALEAAGGIAVRVPGRHLPIIALTADPTAEDPARARAAGMDDLLAKPIHAGQLLATIARHVRA